MAGALLYRTDCPILIQTTAVDTDTIGKAYEVNRKESAVSPREVLFVIQVHLEHSKAQAGDESTVIIETSADKIFWVRTAACSKCDSIHTSLDEILEPSHLLQYLRARVVLDHRDGSDPKAKAIVHLCSNSPVTVTAVD